MTDASSITTTTHPETEAEIAAAVASARAARSPIEIMGGGSRRGLGRRTQAAATLSTARLSGVTLYEPEALTLSAKAGTPIAEVEAAAAAEGQMLAFEPMDHRRLFGTAEAAPTVGGVVACGASGPRRVQAGACRDGLLGLRFVNGAGETVVAGGRVMKNVTGYDLVKLLCGAHGELGVVTEASFKLAPRPEAAATLRLMGLDDDAAVAALTKALGSPYGVSGAAHRPVGREGAPTTMIRIEGFADSVAYRVGRLREALNGRGEAVVDDDPAVVASDWAEMRDVAPLADRTFDGRPAAIWRIATRPSAAPRLTATIKAQRAAEAIYDWGGGLVWLATADDHGAPGGDAGAALIRKETAAVGGDATLVRAADTTRAAVDVFPPQPAPIAALTRGLKEKFDPDGILNPGRMG